MEEQMTRDYLSEYRKLARDAIDLLLDPFKLELSEKTDKLDQRFDDLYDAENSEKAAETQPVSEIFAEMLKRKQAEIDARVQEQEP